MNPAKIFNELSKLPIRKEHLKLIYDAWKIFKSKDLKGKPSEIDDIMKELGIRRDHLKNLLPYLDNPHVSGVLEKVMPNSSQGLRSLAQHVMSQTDSPFAHSETGEPNLGAKQKFPKLPQ